MTIFPVGPTTYSPKLLQSSLVRRQVSQYGPAHIGLQIYEPAPSHGAPAHPRDPDPGTLKLELRFMPAVGLPLVEEEPDPRGPVLLELTDQQLENEQQGVWSYLLDATHTSELGHLTASWEYKVDGRTYRYIDRIQVLEQMPMYSQLTDAEQFIVTQVTWMFGDLFDSTEGGPHLTEAFQTHFNAERITGLMLKAMQRFNIMSQPATNYGLSFLGGSQLSPDVAGVIAHGTYLEVLRHLVRSYTEIPEFTGMNVTHTSRRDYQSRWQSVLAEEEADYKAMVTTVKRGLMNLGSGALLVSGGIFGGGGRSLYRPGMQTSIERSWRFYPASYASSAAYGIK